MVPIAMVPPSIQCIPVIVAGSGGGPLGQASNVSELGLVKKVNGTTNAEGGVPLQTFITQARMGLKMDRFADSRVINNLLA